MRLSDNSKLLVFGNIDLIKYCKSSGISLEKLKKCSIEKMGNNYVFVLSKNNNVKSSSLIQLDVDLDTQPDIVLIMEVTDGKFIEFKTTNKTLRILNN